MDLIFNCPKCNQQLEVDASGAGEEIDCPSCGERIRIPTEDATGAPLRTAGAATPAPGGWGSGASAEHQAVNAIASSAAAKVEMHLKVPVRGDDTKGQMLIAKALPPLEVAAKESDRHLRVKCIRHVDCVEVGHDKFDDIVTAFLAKIGETNLVSLTTIAYSHIDISSQKLLTDYGVMIVYKG